MVHTSLRLVCPAQWLLGSSANAHLSPLGASGEHTVLTIVELNGGHFAATGVPCGHVLGSFDSVSTQSLRLVKLKSFHVRVSLAHMLGAKGMLIFPDGVTAPCGAWPTGVVTRSFTWNVM